ERGRVPHVRARPGRQGGAGADGAGLPAHRLQLRLPGPAPGAGGEALNAAGAVGRGYAPDASFARASGATYGSWFYRVAIRSAGPASAGARSAPAERRRTAPGRCRP